MIAWIGILMILAGASNDAPELVRFALIAGGVAFVVIDRIYPDEESDG